MRFIHQFVVLEQDRFGKSLLALIVTDLAEAKASVDKPQRRMIKIKTGKFHTLTKGDHSGSGTSISKRETEILSLIAQGLDSKYISERLFISVNTVNNHHQKILSKTRSDNTAQALHIPNDLGLYSFY